MASRYHWLLFGLSGSYSGSGSSQTLSDDTISIPVGATVKKIISAGNYVAFAQTGSGYQAIQPFSIGCQAQIVGGPNNGRTIYNIRNAMQMNASPNDDIAPAFRYTAYHIAGDREIGFDAQMSYGKSSDTLPWSIRLIFSVSAIIAGYQSSVVGYRQIAGRILYYK